MNSIVRNYLIELARKRSNQIVTYQKLCDDCNLGLDMSNIADRNEIGRILGDISKFEHKNNRPLLSAFVLRKGDAYEGDGFYKLAEELGFGYWKKLKRDGVFEIEQMTEAIEKWSDDNYYLKSR